MNKFLYQAALVGATLCAFSLAHAQSVIDQYNRSVKTSMEIAPLGPDAFGEQVSMLDGALSFRQVDVSVKLNSGLPMSVGRTLSIQDQTPDQQGRNTYRGGSPFGLMWDLDVPYLKVVADARIGWTGVDGSGSRCSKGDAAPPVQGVTPFSMVSYSSEYYYTGVYANISGYGSEFLRTPFGHTMPNDGNAYKKVSRSNWRASCTPSIKNGAGEGFVVLLPDGIKLTFDWMVSRPTTYLLETNCPHDNGSVVTSTLALNNMPNLPSTTQCQIYVSVPRNEYFLFATKAEDRFGNAVYYDYNPSSPSRLTAIRASEGPSIGLNYNDSGQIASISVNGRSWVYGYDTYGSANRLRSVVLPDGSSWMFDYESDFKHVLTANTNELWGHCKLNLGTKYSETAPGAREDAWIQIKHPSGLVAKYWVRKLIHGTRQTQDEPYACTLQPKQEGPYGIVNFYLYISESSAYQIASLYKKSLSSSTTNTQEWTYNYSPGWQAPYTSVTSVTDPSGSIHRYYYGTDRKINYGQLQREETIKDGSVAGSVSYEYAPTSSSQKYPKHEGGGYSVDSQGWAGPFTGQMHPLIRKTIVQDGSTYVWEVRSDCDSGYCFDQFMRPTAVNSYFQ
ncbi:hypothetical protein [Xanthomonas sacchari]|uniref:hypothetical protein n=1 Tax=Xanthomonas sacchari TaxID=56458 RepID=UPI002258486E|nr:hypothetical protein [Xanthomonas sacchari]